MRNPNNKPQPEQPRDGIRSEGGSAERVSSPKPRRVASPALRDQEIHAQICQAIIEHDLPPGTKLGEEVLSAVFEVNRPRIRKILHRLANEYLVELHPNRGAYVAQPTVKDSREIFDARRLLESTLTEAVITSITRIQIKQLRNFVKTEKEVQLRGDRQAAIRLSGSFHVRLAEVAGNTVLTRFLRQLVAQTSLIIAMYEIPRTSGCNADHHEQLVSLIAAGEAEKAAVFMAEHLTAIENSLRLEDKPSKAVDLQRIFTRVQSGRQAKAL